MADQREQLDRLRIDRDEDEEEGGGRWMIVTFALVVVLIAAGALYTYWPVKSGNEANVAEAPAASTTATGTSSAPAPAGTAAAPPPVSSGGVLSASGYVTARRLATVSAEITGRVTEVLVEEGMSVEAGQVLARLDSTLARIDLEIATANVRSARGAMGASEADSAEAQRALVRVQGLKTGQFSSTADNTRAEATAKSTAARYAQAQGNLASAEQALNRAKAILDKHEIRAPFSGMVTTKDAQPGEIVSPAAAGGGFTRTGICTIVDMNSLEVEVEVNESFISRVKPGQRASATLDAYPDWNIPASVAAIIPTANRDKATVKVRVALEAKDPRILPEMAAKVEFFDDTKAAPATAAAPASQGTTP